MATLISAPTQGSLKITTNGLQYFYCNLKTVTVNFDNYNVYVLNENGQPLVQLPASTITNIAASAGVFSPSTACAAIAGLIITT